MDKLATVSTLLAASNVPHIAVAASAAIGIPPVGMLRSVDLIKFLDHLVYWEIISPADTHLVLSNLGKKIRTYNDSYVDAHWIWDAEHYHWDDHADLMTRVGIEFKKLYTQRIDLLRLSW